MTGALRPTGEPTEEPNFDFKPLNTQTRHGFEDAYENYKEHLTHFFLYFHGKKYNDNFTAIDEAEKKLKGDYYAFNNDWKPQRNKAQTIQGGIFICLNASVEPPEGRKGKPCAKIEGWIDPYSFNGNHTAAAAAVADNVLKQYKSLNAKPVFKAYPDVVVEDVRNALISWRRSVKDSPNASSRYVFHYNGHGVPDPTPSGEFWVFNRQYTQYIPVPIKDLQNWLGGPSVLVYDCNKAGHLVTNFKKCAQAKMDQYAEIQKMNNEQQQQYNNNGRFQPPNTRNANINGNMNGNGNYLPLNPENFLQCYQFAACSSNETLPSLPEVPADLFTCCMTSPIEISVKFFLLRNPLTAKYYEGLFKKDLTQVTADYKLKLHRLGDFDTSYFKKVPDKKDQIADLNYIYTSIVDTIAYTSTNKQLFKKCFRQDTMCCALFRNFLLAQRIMKYYNCTPVSDPALPDCHENELWQHWDLAIEHFLTSLVELKKLNTESSLIKALEDSPRYIFSNFFDASLDHLKNWIQYGRFTQVPPPQLAMILQLLLIPKYRARALKMLAFFVDLGPWAVSLALNVGVFPYMIKLLQSPVVQLKPMLAFVWAKLLACDYQNMQPDLSASTGGSFRYFYYMLLPDKEKLTDMQKKHKNAYFESIAKQAKEQKRLEAKIGKPALSKFKTGNDPTPDADFETRPNKLIDYSNASGVLNYHQLTIALVVLTLFIKGNPNGRDKLYDEDLFHRVIDLVGSDKRTHPNLQLWSALFFSQYWYDSAQAKYTAFKFKVMNTLIETFHDNGSIPDLRAAIIYCFTTFLTTNPLRKLTIELEELEVQLAEEVISNVYDASVAVRKEIVVFLSTFIHKHLNFFKFAAFSSLQEEIVIMEANGELFEFRRKAQIYGTIYSACWKCLLVLSCDPHDEVQNLAQQVICYVLNSISETSELKEPFEFCYNYLVKKLTNPEDDKNINENLINNSFNTKSKRVASSYHPRRRYSGNSDTESIKSAKSSSGVEGLLSKTTSFSNYLKLVTGYQLPEETEDESTERPKFFSVNNNDVLNESYGILPHPLPPRFKPMDLNNEKPEIPLKSKLVEFCREYYQFPQLSSHPESHPLIDERDFKFGKWKKSRNDVIIDSAQREKDLSISGDWSISLNTLPINGSTKVFEFTQFDDYLVTSDSKDIITVWDYKKATTLCSFSNNNPVKTKISQLQFMNEDDIPILLVGSNDGTVKLYKNFDDIDRCRLISAWQSLSNVVGMNDGAHFQFEWQQARGDLIATGNTKSITIWNAFKERCHRVIGKRSAYPVTSLTCDQLDGNIFVAGFSNGDIRIYDKRNDSKKECVREYLTKDSKRTSINNIHMQRGGYRELISASNNGLVQLWDARMTSPVETFNTGTMLKSMRVHEHAPVFVTGSDSVKVWSTSGYTISDFYNDQRNVNLNYKGSYLHKSGNIANLALHPHKMTLAVSSVNDPTINIYHAVQPED